MEWWMWVILVAGVLSVVGHISQKKERAAKEKARELLKRREEAENYIMESGYEEAIKTLMLARANPKKYSETLSDGMKNGNETLTTGLGMLTGLATAAISGISIFGRQIAEAVRERGIFSFMFL